MAEGWTFRWGDRLVSTLPSVWVQPSQTRLSIVHSTIPSSLSPLVRLPISRYRFRVRAWLPDLVWVRRKKRSGKHNVRECVKPLQVGAIGPRELPFRGTNKTLSG